MAWLKTALHVGVLSAIYGLLRLTSLAGWAQEIAVLVVALVMASVAMDTLRHFLPREVMAERQGKAVFITGESEWQKANMLLKLKITSSRSKFFVR